MKSGTTLDDLRALSAFAGDPPAALQALQAHLARIWPDCALALLLVRDMPAGQCRLAGLIGPTGVEFMPASDPQGESSRLPLFDDPLAWRLLAPSNAHVIEIDPSERAFPLAHTLLAPESVLALPMVSDGGIDHWLAILSVEPHRFGHVGLADALREATLAYVLLARSLAVRTLAAESERQHREIAGLADIQRLLLPADPRIRGIEYAVHWQPAATAAGDYYDLMPLTDFEAPDFPRDRMPDVWGLVLADVSGHGAAAAMEAVQLDAILRTYKGDEPPGGPAGAVNYANRYFFSRRQRRHFLTAFAASYRPEAGQLHYVSAGHRPALVRHADAVRQIGRDRDGGIPMGILREHRWENSITDFGAGDLLVVYTDGIVEARDRNGRMFGTDRLMHLVGAGNSDPHDVLGRIRAALFEHQESGIGTDDQTLIVLRQL